MMHHFPFSAIVGQDQLKAALVLGAVQPSLGGVLLRGEKGTAKSVAAHGLAAVLPQRPAFVEVPAGISREELLGTFDPAEARRFGQAALQPGLLARAHRGILYVDRVNLMPEGLLEAVLEIQRVGVNRLHDQGEQVHHACQFLLIASLSPEEGDLRPHFLDRFAISVVVEGIRELGPRTEILQRCLEFERDPAGFCTRFEGDDARLAERIQSARDALAEVTCPPEILQLAVNISNSVDTPGHRADLLLVKASCALAALEGLTEVGAPEVQSAASLVLPHRMRTAGTADEPRLAEVFRRDHFAPAG